MLKVALIGLGRMGRGHFNVYKQFENEGYPVKLVAVCDCDESKLRGGEAAKLNLEKVAKTSDSIDYSAYNRYTDYRELLKNEDVDFVDIVVPTYLHHEVTIAALQCGRHVLCEKPMSISTELCVQMIDAAKRAGKMLMIGQVLHFWSEYECLKEYVASGKFGKVQAAYFYRGGVQDHKKNGSFEDWIITREKGGGGLFDQHIHDTDMIRWLFGTPNAVSTIGKTIHPKSAYDIVSTNYLYDDDKVVNAQDDADLKGTYGFRYGYKVHFDDGMMLLTDGKLTVFPHNEKEFVVEHAEENPYYNEIKYFTQCLNSNTPPLLSLPEDAMETVRIALAEIESADMRGDKVRL